MAENLENKEIAVKVSGVKKNINLVRSAAEHYKLIYRVGGQELEEKKIQILK